MASTNATNTLGPNETPERVYETVYTVVVFDKGIPVLDESFPTTSERRNAVVGLLLDRYDQVSAESVAEILAPYGGANANEALRKVIWLYSECGIDVHLGERQHDVGPAALYTTFTDYGDGTTFAEHFGSRAERLVELRQRAANVAEGHPVEFFDTADESTCKKIIESTILSPSGCLHLFDARRQDVGGTYMTYATEA